MKRKVVILDTCLACVWLKVPGKEVVGAANDQWNTARVQSEITKRTREGYEIVLPIAVMIEMGNHIAQIKQDNRVEYIERFRFMMSAALEGTSPWILFNNQNELWKRDRLMPLIDTWKTLNEQGEKHSLGDVSILGIATYYRNAGYEVAILTADSLLKAYEQVNLWHISPEHHAKDEPLVPRRKNRK
jgi:hypothetical protein